MDLLDQKETGSVKYKARNNHFTPAIYLLPVSTVSVLTVRG